MLSRTFTAALVAATLFAVPALAVELKPYQKEALEILIKALPEEHKAAARAQFEQILAPMNEMQVAMMVSAAEQAMAEDAAEEDTAADEDYGDTEEQVATPEDLAFNEKQYEPVVRKLWEASRDCDLYVEETLANNMSGETYAAWGRAWRYDLPAMRLADLHNAPSTYENFAMTFRGMAPQDGRYTFDFSHVKTSCDRGAIEAAVKTAYADYDKLGKAFVPEVKAAAEADDFSKADAIVAKASAKVAVIVKRLEQAVAEHRPNGSEALLQALMYGKRVK
ncbi:hypothetical protein [Kordiimonas gwangyangensis]|uniref:hypothetical protein n=1 Tax=Kordiimonas gwangyangensis TaxID=288022 RepID=UPI0003600283|nr:hypothetical protein [Kordiimonas gwangyangensis]